MCCASRGGGCPRSRGSALPSLRGLHERELGLEGDVVGECEAAAGQRSVPVEAERGAIDDRGQREAVALVPVRVGDRTGDGPFERCGPGHALDREVALEAAGGDGGAGERDLRMTLGVEEVRRLEMRLQVLVLDLDAGDLRFAGELAVSKGRLEVRQLARERGDAEVLDLEADAR